jgi:DNA-binding GntR family transcriptional regulator
MKATEMTETASVTHDPRLHVQIATDLRAKLRTGNITAGTTLPITSLAREWGASRETVRKALRTLENDGLIRRYPRYGYRVPPQQAPPAPENEPQPRQAATDPGKAASHEQPMQLKPLLDQIDKTVDQLLEEITALKAIAAARGSR